MAEHLGHVERHLVVGRHVRRRPLGAVKRDYITRFGITPRQFNAVAGGLEGMVKAGRSAVTRGIRRLVRRIRHLRSHLTTLASTCAREDRLDRRRTLRALLPQKKRHFNTPERRLASPREDAGRPVPGICFGGRRMFHTQFFLKETGFRTHRRHRS